MQKLSKDQIEIIAGGLGCMCPGKYGAPGMPYIVINEVACVNRCCTGADNSAYCTFEDSPKKHNLRFANLNCHSCAIPQQKPPAARIYPDVSHVFN